jgi:ATP-dependent Clp protease adaptor protein ClpS
MASNPKPDIIVEETVETKLAPRFSVILWDSPDHTFDYVIEMMRKLFNKTLAEAMEVAVVVHTEGRAMCGVFGREESEEKRDQIHAYGPDPRITRCKGSMFATIESVDE